MRHFGETSRNWLDQRPLSSTACAGNVSKSSIPAVLLLQPEVGGTSSNPVASGMVIMRGAEGLFAVAGIICKLQIIREKYVKNVFF